MYLPHGDAEFAREHQRHLLALAGALDGIRTVPRRPRSRAQLFSARLSAWTRRLSGLPAPASAQQGC